MRAFFKTSCGGNFLPFAVNVSNGVEFSRIGYVAGNGRDFFIPTLKREVIIVVVRFHGSGFGSNGSCAVVQSFGFKRFVVVILERNVIFVYRSRFGISFTFFKRKFGGKVVRIRVLSVIGSEFCFNFFKFRRSVACGIRDVFLRTVDESQRSVVNLFFRTRSEFREYERAAVIVDCVHSETVNQTVFVRKEFCVYLYVDIFLEYVNPTFVDVYDFGIRSVEFSDLYVPDACVIPQNRLKIYRLNFFGGNGILQYDIVKRIFEISSAIRKSVFIPLRNACPVRSQETPRVIFGGRVLFIKYCQRSFFMNGGNIAEYQLRSCGDIRNLKIKTFYQTVFVFKTFRCNTHIEVALITFGISSRVIKHVRSLIYFISA